MKTCTRCGETKPLDDYSPHPDTRDGFNTHCKRCKAQVTRNWIDKNRERAAKTKRKSYLRNRERENAASRAYRKRYPERRKAREHLRAALDRGDVVCPTSCGRCAAPGSVQAHHPDYSRPLEVEWLCSRCHGDEHRVQPKEVASA